MMKLNIDQVLDYIADGESDPAIQAQLELDPRGPELLEQARLLKEMLQGYERARVEDGRSGYTQEPNTDFNLGVGSMPMRLSADELPSTGRHKTAPLGKADLSRIQDAARESMRSTTRLGVLRVRRMDGELTFEPDRTREEVSFPRARLRTLSPSLREPQIQERSAFADRPSRPEIEAWGGDLRITIRLKQVPELFLQLNVLDRFGLPARSLDITYVPERGPFSRARTDLKGTATLAAPEVHGILRFESKRAHQLQIRIEN